MIYFIVTWYEYLSYFLQSCPLGCSNCVEIDMLFNFLGPKAQPFMNISVQVWGTLLVTSYPEHTENKHKVFPGLVLCSHDTWQMMLANSSYF
jgi:hypothetical protein